MVEMSSFQLETIREFHPLVSGMLNITPDHLDRHKSMPAYMAAKARIFENQDSTDYALINYDDELVRQLAANCPAKVWFFSQKQPLQQGGFFWLTARSIIAHQGRIHPICKQNEVLLRGRHNMENALCAAGMAFAMGLGLK